MSISRLLCTATEHQVRYFVRGHLGLKTFSHILNDPRTQDIPLILETPAFDVTSGANKNQFKPGKGWEIWHSEVNVLHKLAGCQSRSDETIDLEAWGEQLRSVVKRVSSTQAKNKAKKKDGANKKNADQDDEGDSSSDEGHPDNA